MKASAKQRVTTEEAPVSSVRATTGIDVTARWKDIDRIVRAYFRSEETQSYLRARALDGFAGRRVEVEDLVQLVTLTIWRRNGMRSAYDPARASFSKYVWVTARSVLSHATERRDTESPVLDLRVWETWGDGGADEDLLPEAMPAAYQASAGRGTCEAPRSARRR